MRMLWMITSQFLDVAYPYCPTVMGHQLPAADVSVPSCISSNFGKILRHCCLWLDRDVRHGEPSTISTANQCQLCMYVCLSVCLSVCMYVCLYVCMYVGRYTYIYPIYIYTQYFSITLEALELGIVENFGNPGILPADPQLPVSANSRTTWGIKE